MTFSRKYELTMFLLLENAELQAHFGFLHVSWPYFQCYFHLDTGHIYIYFKPKALDGLFIYFLVFFMLPISSFITYTLLVCVVVQEFKKAGYCTFFSTLLLYWVQFGLSIYINQLSVTMAKYQRQVSPNEKKFILSVVSSQDQIVPCLWVSATSAIMARLCNYKLIIL